MEDDSGLVSFVSMDMSASITRHKDRRATIEGYVPRGILPSHWMFKHIREIPAVMALFTVADGCEDEKNWRKLETDLMSQVSVVRSDNGPSCLALPTASSIFPRYNNQSRRHRLFVVLVQQAATADTISEDRLALLRRKLSLEQRSVAVFGTANASEARQKSSLREAGRWKGDEEERGWGCKWRSDLPITAERSSPPHFRIVQMMHELGVAFYKDEATFVTRLAEQVSRQVQPALYVRYQFKLAFYAEFRKEPDKALRSVTMFLSPPLLPLSLPLSPPSRRMACRSLRNAGQHPNR